MITVKDKNQERIVRHKRVRKNISGTSEKPRLCVYKSLSNIYAQLIDDTKGVTIVSASTLDKDIAEKIKGKTKTEAAKIVGETVGQKAKAKKIKEAEKFDKDRQRRL